MPNRATVPIHCTKPCKDLSLNTSFRKKKFVLLSQKTMLPTVAQLCVTVRRKLWQRAANCPQGLIVSRLTEHSWLLQQDVFQTKLWQSCGGVHVSSIHNREYGQDYLGLAPPCTVLQHYPDKLWTLQQVYMASHHTIRDHAYGWYHMYTSTAHPQWLQSVGAGNPGDFIPDQYQLC